MRGSVFITVKFTVIIMIIMVIITAINTVISFRDLSRWSCDHRWRVDAQIAVTSKLVLQA